MHSYPSIESLRHVIHSINIHCENFSVPKPTIKFRGTVKLHGTNGGVRVSPAGVVAQSRNNVLAIGSDNMGFAHFVAPRGEEFKRIAAEFAVGDDVILYGEWCGNGIMKNMAINGVPKMFVIFGVYDVAGDEWLKFDSAALDVNDRTWYNNQNIYFIDQAETYDITIDFNDPAVAATELSNLTLQVEAACPFGKLFNQEGIGEGLVWVSYDYPVTFKFKTKGLLHKKGGRKEKVAITSEKMEAISDVVDEILPEWRLEQGIEALREAKVPMTNQAIGDYIKWVAQDILKEEADTIAANEFTWKELNSQVSTRARVFFMNFLDVEAGLA